MTNAYLIDMKSDVEAVTNVNVVSSVKVRKVSTKSPDSEKEDVDESRNDAKHDNELMQRMLKM